MPGTGGRESDEPRRNREIFARRFRFFPGKETRPCDRLSPSADFAQRNLPPFTLFQLPISPLNFPVFFRPDRGPTTSIDLPNAAVTAIEEFLAGRKSRAPLWAERSMARRKPRPHTLIAWTMLNLIAHSPCHPGTPPARLGRTGRAFPPALVRAPGRAEARERSRGGVTGGVGRESEYGPGPEPGDGGRGRRPAAVPPRPVQTRGRRANHRRAAARGPRFVHFTHGSFRAVGMLSPSSHARPV